MGGVDQQSDATPCIGKKQWIAHFGRTTYARTADYRYERCLFDPAHKFAGCIAGINEVLRRQGLLEGNWCLDDEESLSPGQGEEIDRVYKAYPHLNDDTFVHEHLDEWLR